MATINAPNGIQTVNGIQVGGNGSPITRLFNPSQVVEPLLTASINANLTADVDTLGLGNQIVLNDAKQTGQDQDFIIWVHNLGLTAADTAVCGWWWTGSGNTITVRFCNPTTSPVTPDGGSALPVSIGVY